MLLVRNNLENYEIAPCISYFIYFIIFAYEKFRYDEINKITAY